MKVYTKTAIKEPRLFLEARAYLNPHPHRELRTVDELNSHIGLIRDQELTQITKMERIQDRLFTLGAILATDPEKAVLKNGKTSYIPKISEADIELLENEIDSMETELPR